MLVMLVDVFVWSNSWFWPLMCCGFYACSYIVHPIVISSTPSFLFQNEKETRGKLKIESLNFSVHILESIRPICSSYYPRLFKSRNEILFKRVVLSHPKISIVGCEYIYEWTYSFSTFLKNFTDFLDIILIFPRAKSISWKVLESFSQNSSILLMLQTISRIFLEFFWIFYYIFGLKDLSWLIQICFNPKNIF